MALVFINPLRQMQDQPFITEHLIIITATVPSSSISWQASFINEKVAPQRLVSPQQGSTSVVLKAYQLRSHRTSFPH
jgi:hypothetical protein